MAVALAGGAWVLSHGTESKAQAAASTPPESAQTQVVHLKTAAFPALLTQDKPVVMDFWATWCPPCRIQGPIMDQLSVLAGNRAIVAKVNVDEEGQLAARFDVQAIPTLVVLRNGKEVSRFVGIQQTQTLMRALGISPS
jgi:thioredoxin 1